MFLDEDRTGVEKSKTLKAFMNQAYVFLCFICHGHKANRVIDFRCPFLYVEKHKIKFS